MHTLADLAKVLNRSAVYVSSLQSRFELPVFPADGYSDAYFAFLRGVCRLRTLAVSEETLRDLWQIEKKLLQLVHVDSTGSPTWLIDSCGATTTPSRRLLLSNFDMGVVIQAKEVQLGLNFATTSPELFKGHEMGEDAVRVLNDYRKAYARILAQVKSERENVREVLAWSNRF
ncbi:MAG: hypothetical protein AB7I98_00060 [Verrucomicrobiales bacterium]